MSARIRASAVACAAVAGAAATQPIAVYFSPQDRPGDAVVSALGRARRQILAAIYDLTDLRIAQVARRVAAAGRFPAHRGERHKTPNEVESMRSSQEEEEGAMGGRSEEDPLGRELPPRAKLSEHEHDPKRVDRLQAVAQPHRVPDADAAPRPLKHRAARE